MHSSSSELATGQWEKLKLLLAEIVPRNSFYRRKAEGVLPIAEMPDLDYFCQHWPFTTKAELVEDQKRFPPYGSNLTFPLPCYTRCHQTSGTSGTPLRWLDTPDTWQWMLDHWKKVYSTAGVAESDRIFFAFSFGPFLGFWTAFESALQIGCFCLPGGGLSSAGRIQAILENKITVICSTPTYALRLGEIAAAENIDLSKGDVKLLLLAGEPGGCIHATRERLQSVWPGAATSDHHGMTEVGPVSYECPRRPGNLHIIESSYLAETVEMGTGAPAHPGAPGELVLTTLGRGGSPLLRYRTGDMVKLGPREICPCGTLDRLMEGGIIGRVDDMVVVRGVNVFPGAVEEIVRACGGVSEYQVKITNDRSLVQLALDVEPENPQENPELLGSRLTKAFYTALTLRVPVTVVGAGTLPRFEMKSNRWIRV